MHIICFETDVIEKRYDLKYTFPHRIHKNGDTTFMQKLVLKTALIVLAAGLTGCSQNMPSISGILPSSTPTQAVSPDKQGVIGKSVDQAGKETNVNVTMAGGGEISLKSMDAEDKTKMSRALDAGTGKSTRWVNGVSGISYTVTPIKKVVIQGNPFCRDYTVVAEKGNYTKESHGTACVTTDGSWHTV
jgi:surface antigen